MANTDTSWMNNGNITVETPKPQQNFQEQKSSQRQRISDEERIKYDTYTEEELADVNAITVTVPDEQTPIVVFFGPKSSGKTLAMLRMVRYLELVGYTVEPEYVFRPRTDVHYARMCDNLKNMVYDGYAPGGTNIISFMLLKVLDQRGNPMFQILEAPGEHYFMEGENANLNFPTYINQIRTSKNRKVWVFFAEQDWGENQGIRNMYAQKICNMQSLIKPNDKVVLLFNKVDKQRTRQYNNVGRPILNTFLRNVKNQYPRILSKYERTGLSATLFGKYNCRFVCFSSGTFNPTTNGREVWTPEEDFYCQDLLKAILK